LPILEPPLAQARGTPERANVARRVIAVAANGHRRRATHGFLHRTVAVEVDVAVVVCVARRYFAQPGRYDRRPETDVIAEGTCDLVVDVVLRPIAHHCVKSVEDLPPDIKRGWFVSLGRNNFARVDDPVGQRPACASPVAVDRV